MKALAYYGNDQKAHNQIALEQVQHEDYFPQISQNDMLETILQAVERVWENANSFPKESDTIDRLQNNKRKLRDSASAR
jgi:hypothetical protein